MTQPDLHLFAVLADCYTPILLLVAVVEIGRSWIAGNRLHLAQFIYATVVVYLLMFIDKVLQLWQMVGLDYSTHSAAAFALTLVIGLEKRVLYKLTLALSLIVYGCLMNLLRYHNWGDMLTTVLTIGICLVPVLRLSKPTKTSFSAA